MDGNEAALLGNDAALLDNDNAHLDNDAALLVVMVQCSGCW